MTYTVLAGGGASTERRRQVEQPRDFWPFTRPLRAVLRVFAAWGRSVEDHIYRRRRRRVLSFYAAFLLAERRTAAHAVAINPLKPTVAIWVQL